MVIPTRQCEIKLSENLQENIVKCVDKIGPKIWTAIQILFDFAIEMKDNGMIDDLDLIVGIFSELTNLTKLNLSYNKITNLPKGIFDGLTNLQHINLINNSLETIHLSTKEFLKNNNIEVIL